MMAFTHEWFTDDGSYRWDAHCLEMPELLGTGTTQEDAVDDLYEQLMFELHRVAKH